MYFCMQLKINDQRAANLVRPPRSPAQLIYQGDNSQTGLRRGGSVASGGVNHYRPRFKVCTTCGKKGKTLESVAGD